MSDSGWVYCRDSSLLVAECNQWNKGLFREILWEYGALSPSILKDRKAKGWLHFENGSRTGFALGRQIRDYWHFEELWGQSEGSSELPFRLGSEDEARVRTFRKLLVKLGRRVLIRAPVDNPLANLLAHGIGAQWVGGFLLGTRDLFGKCIVEVPTGIKLRRFRRGDEKHMSRIHLGLFKFQFSPRLFLKWASSPNCKTTMAVSDGRVVGYLTAEKRRHQRYGDFNIAVDSTFHGRGIGSSLMESGLNDLFAMGCRTAVADYWVQNAKVQGLNRKYGFTIVRAYNYFHANNPSRLVPS